MFEIGRMVSCLLKLDSGWRFMSLLLYALLNSPSYPLNWRLHVFQSQSGRCGEEKNPLLCLDRSVIHLSSPDSPNPWLASNMLPAE